MIIKGLQKTTLLDYPGEIACTVFLAGCNMRCPYCHNPSIVFGEGEDISVDELIGFLKSRVGRLGAVCISGGEPTLHSDLRQLIESIKELGFLVKLDTNGTNPKMLSELIQDRLVDYVAMDIKNSPEKYIETAGLGAECRAQSAELILDNVKQSVAILMQNRVEYEFRTTVTAQLHSVEDMDSIGRLIGGAEKYFLQYYREEGQQIAGGFTTPDPESMRALLERIKKYVPKAEIRG